MTIRWIFQSISGMGNDRIMEKDLPIIDVKTIQWRLEKTKVK